MMNSINILINVLINSDAVYALLVSAYLCACISMQHMRINIDNNNDSATPTNSHAWKGRSQAWNWRVAPGLGKAGIAWNYLAFGRRSGSNDETLKRKETIQKASTDGFDL